MSKEEEIKGVMKPYVVFLMDKVNRVYNAWDEHPLEPRIPLEEALRLVNFLPRSLKKLLKKDAEEIRKELDRCYRLQGTDLFTTQLLRNRVANQVASRRLQPFVDKMTDWLDERGYFERPYFTDFNPHPEHIRVKE
jgi:hypothetical protein